MNFPLEKYSAHVNNRFRSHCRFLFTSQRKPLFTSPESLFTSPGTFIHIERNTHLAKLDPSLPVYDFKTLKKQLNETLSSERLIASVSVVFGVLATVLAALGLYGVMAFVVTRRTREIGLRMALGAPRSSVQWLVMREALVLLGGGLVVGVSGAYALTRYVSSLLFGITPTDTWTAAASIALLGLVAIVASVLPARRASAVEPTVALHYE